MFELAKTFAFALAALMTGLFVFFACSRRDIIRQYIKPVTCAAVLSQAAAFLSPSILFYNILAGAIVPAFASRPNLIAPIYIFLLLTLPLVSTPITLGGIYLVSWDISISLTLGACLALLLQKPTKAIRTGHWDWPVMLLFGLLVLALARSTTATDIVRIILTTGLQILVPYFVLSRAIRSEDGFRMAIVGIIAATAALSALAVYEAFTTWPMYRMIWSHYGISLGSGASVKVRAGLLRSPGPFPEPTSFAYCLAIGTVAAVATRRLFKSKIHHYILLALFFIGICAPQSRGAWLGLLVGIVAVDLYMARYARIGRNLAITAFLAAAVFAAAQLSPAVGRLTGLNGDAQGSVDYRTQLLSRGTEELWRNPVFGAPIEQVLFSLRDLTQGEGIVDIVNSYLYISLIAGLTGLVVFIISLLAPVLFLLSSRSSLQADERLRQNAFVFGGMVSAMSMLSATSIGGRNTWMIVAMMAFTAATRNLSKNSKAQAIERHDQKAGLHQVHTP